MKQDFSEAMGEDENETGKEQMLSLKKKTMLGKWWSAYFKLGIRCKIFDAQSNENTQYNSVQRSISSQLLLAPSNCSSIWNINN